MFDYAWVAEYDGMRWHIGIDKRIRGNQHIITNCNSTYNCAVYSYPHAISNNRTSFSFAAVFLADCHSLVDIAVFSYAGSSVDSNAERVPDVQARTNFAATTYFSTIQKFRNFEYQSVEFSKD